MSKVVRTTIRIHKLSLKFFHILRSFEEAKVQYEAEKAKLNDGVIRLKETNKTGRIENQNLKWKLSEQNLILESQRQKTG